MGKNGEKRVNIVLFTPLIAALNKFEPPEANTIEQVVNYVPMCNVLPCYSLLIWLLLDRNLANSPFAHEQQ